MDQEPLLPPSLMTHNSNPLPVTDIEAFLFPPDTQFPRSKSGLHRARTAPIMRHLHLKEVADSPNPTSAGCSGSVLKYAVALLLIYLSLGVLVYSTNPQGFSGIETHPAVDALYFCIVTLCTIGYGDIAPLTPTTKAFACLFVLVGFGLIDVLLSAALSYILDLQEGMILSHVQARARARAGEGASKYIFDSNKGRMRIRMKVGLAVGVVILCIGAGTLALYLLEDLNWMDALYLSIMSVTTVGFGDRAFKTLPGRVFASFWLLISTLAVARAFLYLAEARMDKRQRMISKRVLHKDLTVDDLDAADLNHNGFISKAEFVIYKLKEMGKITDNDILVICNQFNKLDVNNTGKITRPDVLNHSR